MNVYFRILIVFVFSVRPFYGQTYNSEISDTEIYDFLNWFSRSERSERESNIKRKLVSNSIRVWYSGNLIFGDSTSKGSRYYIFNKKVSDSIFSKVEKEYLIKQFHSLKDSIWHTTFDRSRMAEYDYSTEKRGINYYSVPLFSLDKTHVMISHLFFCDNAYISTGFYIYKRTKKHKWKFVAKT